MTMKKAGAVFSVVSLVLVAMACGGSKTAAKGESIPPVSSRMGKAEVVSVPQQVEVSGTVEAARQAAVSSRVMANVTAVLVHQGDAVKAGQVLVEIDPRTADGQVAQARGALGQAQAGLALAQRNHERFKALAAKGAASELELDMANMQYEQAKAAVAQAQGAVEAASSVAKESRVVAPFAGRVSAKMVDIGDLAAPGRPLVSIESATGRRLVVAVPESTLVASGLKIGSVVPLRLDAFQAQGESHGTVAELAPGADPASHTFMVKIELEGSESPTGVAGRAWISTGERQAIVVPASAVMAQGGVTMVVIRDASGLARTRVVTTGAPLPDGRIEALSGLAGGEDVLVDLHALPTDGAPVEEVHS